MLRGVAASDHRGNQTKQRRLDSNFLAAEAASDVGKSRLSTPEDGLHSQAKRTAEHSLLERR